MDRIFGVSGLLANSLPGYEARTGQLAMAEAVALLLDRGNDLAEDPARETSCLVVEAETGLGKTLAYLIPAVLSGRKVVVSTNTRALQDQILQREIPLIQRLIDPDLRALCVKGRQNYLCLHRWNQHLASRQVGLFDEDESEAIPAWIKETVHGDRSELSWLPASSALWHKISCLSHYCLGTACPEAQGCFLNRLRRDAAASRLLIVNHHLLFSDLAVRRTGYGEVLPRYEAVFFDEAHHVEQVATTYFGLSLSTYQLLDLAGDIERQAEQELAAASRKKVVLAAGRLQASAERFAALFPVDRGRYPLDGFLRDSQAFPAGRDDLRQALAQLGHSLDRIEDSQGLWAPLQERIADLGERLLAITAEQFDDLPTEEIRHVHWFERSERNLALFATPVDVAADLRQTLFAGGIPCLFTSATLTTGKGFGYFLDRMGLPRDTPCLSLPSPFDYRHRTLLFVPDAFPADTGSPAYAQAQHETMADLINHARGRSLMLFTSLLSMDRAYLALRDRLAYPLLVQGQAPRRTLLRRFAEETASVLFAVASFWEGVDVPGEALSLVIIDKLPFEVPTDPVIMARINRIKAEGGNPFVDFQVPRAILTLRQGVGRLMRTAGDRGVIAILDTRLFTKGYGRHFLNSLPPSPLTRDIGEVATFFRDCHGTG